MSERDVQRIRALSEVLGGRRTVGSAAAVLAVTPRQARRLLARLRDGGGGVIVHRLRGRPSNHRIEPRSGSALCSLRRPQRAGWPASPGILVSAGMLLTMPGLAVQADVKAIFLNSPMWFRSAVRSASLFQ